MLTPLTDWPENLKDVIDWFLRVGEMDKDGDGLGNTTKLKDAVDKLAGFTEATEGLGKFYIEGLFKKVTEGLQQLIGYDSGDRELNGEGIGRKQSSPYTSSYSGQAKWEANLNSATSSEAQKAASIFLGSMPMVYYFVTYLYFKCTVGRDGWSGNKLTDNQQGLGFFMVSMDFVSDQLNGTKSGSDIAKLMDDEPNGFDGLNGVDKSQHCFEDFLKKLKEKYGETKITKAMQCPLHTLYLASTAYLKSKFENGKGYDSDENISTIKNNLESFKGACRSEQYLQDEFAKFLSEI
ncbi:variant erythrocyte surface antigen-1 family protein [Babesia caballi]|uniref:Variant erythrocyte surface antigen-1 family protein n=1 Tax=Babesia caballi TaxID=5871 RepID=A0AAV4LVC5_BABCB|nr:variant erythrocyte surface antigen-1 family protein [Babesia caballi]